MGLLANATHRGVTLTKIEVTMEADIDISAVWGVGDTPADKVPGFQHRDHSSDVALLPERGRHVSVAGLNLGSTDRQRT